MLHWITMPFSLMQACTEELMSQLVGGKTFSVFRLPYLNAVCWSNAIRSVRSTYTQTGRPSSHLTLLPIGYRLQRHSAPANLHT
jgi:hypothetical protein